MNIGELVLDVLVQEGKTQSWLANRLKLSKTTLNNKLKNNTLRAEEFIKIDIILDLNYEKIKEEIKKDVDTNLIKIAYCIKKGSTNGYYPEWKLSLKDVDFKDIDNSMFYSISNAVSNGTTSGIVNNIEWVLEIRDK